MRRVACALVHHPILDREQRIVTTAITNLDLHDIARSSHTFGLERFYACHPVAAQRELAERVRGHWTADGSGAKRIPDRRPALETLAVVERLEAAEAQHGAGAGCELWVTSAQPGPADLAHDDARALLATEGTPVLLVFGTGWGLAPEVLARATRRLAPIRSPRADGYNHLSVRAAAAILFDRLLNR